MRTEVVYEVGYHVGKNAVGQGIGVAGVNYVRIACAVSILNDESVWPALISIDPG